MLDARLGGLGVERQMPGAVHGERRLPQPVQSGVVGSLREPHRELPEVGGAIRPARPALVQHRHDRQ